MSTDVFLIPVKLSRSVIEQIVSAERVQRWGH